MSVPGGAAFKLKCNPTSFVAKKLYWDGMSGFESSVSVMFMTLARQSRVFFDVGANIGYYSLLAASLNSALKIYSFEPVPAPFRYLSDSVALNEFHNITPVEVAISDQDGETTFYLSRNPKFASFISDHLTSTGSLDKGQGHRTHLIDEVQVKTQTLDHFVEEQEVPGVDLMKLDTEATEHLVLAGAQNILKKHKPTVFCEVLSGKVEDEIAAAFSEHGYLMFRLDDDEIVPVTDLKHPKGTSNDHLMVHPDRIKDVTRFISG